MTDPMRAVVFHGYGPPEMAQVREVEMPAVGDAQVLVRVRAAAVNPVDWRRLTGTPMYPMRTRGGLRRPKDQRLGVDCAGVVEAIGPEVTIFRPGDEVFGAAGGAFAEYATMREGGSMAHKPASLTFEQAAAVPVAAVTALQGLRDHGRLQPGQRVLVNGASGGVGTFAVQLAKALGAEVTGVCSTPNIELVRSLGADHVIDYTRADFTRAGHRYDLLLDNVGNRSWSQYRRVLTPEARLVMVGGPQTNRLTGSLGHILLIRLASRRSQRTAVKFRATITKADLEVLADMLEAGTVTPVIDRRYPLDETADALRYLGQGHVRGKLVITM
jgi:NADPH:quinone reductase-like Zn-dependent oxidoreductase